MNRIGLDELQKKNTNPNTSRQPSRNSSSSDQGQWERVETAIFLYRWHWILDVAANLDIWLFWILADSLAKTTSTKAGEKRRRQPSSTRGDIGFIEKKEKSGDIRFLRKQGKVFKMSWLTPYLLKASLHCFGDIFVNLLIFLLTC